MPSHPSHQAIHLQKGITTRHNRDQTFVQSPHSTIAPATTPMATTTFTAAVCNGSATPPELELVAPDPPPLEALDPAAALLGCGAGAGAWLELENASNVNVCPFTAIAPLLPSEMYSPPINCAGPPGTSDLPSTAAWPDISVTVKIAPAAVKTAISVPDGAAVVAGAVVLFACVKVLCTGGVVVAATAFAIGSAARRRMSCHQLRCASPRCAPSASAKASASATSCLLSCW